MAPVPGRDVENCLTPCHGLKISGEKAQDGRSFLSASIIGGERRTTCQPLLMLADNVFPKGDTGRRRLRANRCVPDLGLCTPWRRSSKTSRISDWKLQLATHGEGPSGR